MIHYPPIRLCCINFIIFAWSDLGITWLKVRWQNAFPQQNPACCRIFCLKKARKLLSNTIFKGWGKPYHCALCVWLYCEGKFFSRTRRREEKVKVLEKLYISICLCICSSNSNNKINYNKLDDYTNDDSNNKYCEDFQDYHYHHYYSCYNFYNDHIDNNIYLYEHKQCT